MTFDAAGNLWLYATPSAVGADPSCAQSQFETCLWGVDPATAATQFVGAVPPELFVPGLTASCSEVIGIAGQVQSPFTTSLDRVDTATAALEEIVALTDVEAQAPDQ